MKKTFYPQPGPLRALADAWQCRRTVRAWQRRQRRAGRRGRLAARLRAWPYWHATGQLLYAVGFFIEYQVIRAGRWLLWLLGLLLRGLAWWLLMLLQPLQQAHAAAGPPGRGARAARAVGAAVVALCAAGCVVLFRTALAQPYLLRVEADGEVLGYITGEQTLNNAVSAVYERIENARAVTEAAGQGLDASALAVQPTYTLAATSRQPMTQTELINALLRLSGGTLQEGTAVYVDGALWFVTDEGDHLRSYLQNLLTPYADAYDPDQRVEFVHNVQLADGLFFADSVQPGAQIVQQLNEADEQPLQVCTIERSIHTEEIPYPTVTEESAAYEYGETIQLQAGENGLREVTQDTVMIDGATTEVRTIAVETLREPVTEHLMTGTKLKDFMYGSINGVDFIWPVPQYRYLSRWMGGSHTGTDIAGPEGTPIVAAADGVVTTAYHWNGIVTRGDWNSYGNYVVIDHENGYSTLYGHMIYFVVNVGEYVEAGQVIGYMGETGYAFGDHLHFEMFGPNGRFNAHAAFPNVPRWN